MTVPYTFSNQIGPIPLSELDQNFAAVSLNVDTAVTVTGNDQPNITSVGVLNSLILNANSIALGTNTYANNANYTIGIGGNAGANSQRYNAISIGGFAGRESQGANSVAIGWYAGANSQDNNAIALGPRAGQNTQNFGAIAIGFFAGNTNQGANSVALGQRAGFEGQGGKAIAIGLLAGNSNQGANSVAIGSNAGNPLMSQNSICINGTGNNLSATNVNSLYIAPIRNSSFNVTNSLYYNTSTSEITYAPAASGSSYDNSNVSTFLADFGSNTISTTGNITTDGFFIGTFVGNITGNLVVPGSNTQVLYNNDGNAGASTALTFDSASNVLVLTGNITTTNISATGNVYSNGNIAMVSDLARNTYVANVAPTSGDGNVGDIWYQTY